MASISFFAWIYVAMTGKGRVQRGQNWAARFRGLGAGACCTQIWGARGGSSRMQDSYSRNLLQDPLQGRGQTASMPPFGKGLLPHM